MNCKSRNTTVFVDGVYFRARLISITDATLPTEDHPGECVVCFESTHKEEIDILYGTLPEVMVRVIAYDRPDNPQNGELFCRVKLNKAKIGYVGYDADRFYWKIVANADILEWGENLDK